MGAVPQVIVLPDQPHQLGEFQRSVFVVGLDGRFAGDRVVQILDQIGGDLPVVGGDFRRDLRHHCGDVQLIEEKGRLPDEKAAVPEIFGGEARILKEV